MVFVLISNRGRLQHSKEKSTWYAPPSKMGVGSKLLERKTWGGSEFFHGFVIEGGSGNLWGKWKITQPQYKTTTLISHMLEKGYYILRS